MMRDLNTEFRDNVHRKYAYNFNYPACMTSC